MKFFFITIIVVLVCASTFAQQRPHYTQYILNNYILNPAISGIENYTDVKISARDQWIGLNGAPRTAYLTIQGPIGKKIIERTLRPTKYREQIQGAGLIGNLTQPQNL